MLKTMRKHFCKNETLLPLEIAPNKEVLIKYGGNWTDDDYQYYIDTPNLIFDNSSPLLISIQPSLNIFRKQNTTMEESKPEVKKYRLCRQKALHNII